MIWGKRAKEIKQLQENMPPAEVAMPSTFPTTPPEMTNFLSFNSTDRTLHQVQSVLNIEPCCDADVVGVLEKTEGVDPMIGSYRLDKRLWEDMGSPAQVTISVHPGNHLN